MNKKLLPCPFCGSKARIFNFGPGIYENAPIQIECSRDTCGCVTNRWFRTEKQAINHWNTRKEKE